MTRSRRSLCSPAASAPVAALALALVLASAAREAGAADAGAADALFVEGRALLQEQKFAAACPKLAESHRLDPATGTLLALALCYEGQGKTASAWAAYVEVVARAHGEKNAQREAAAKERASALAPKLPRLVVELAPGAVKPPGFRLMRDGVVVEESALGTEVPVDPGEHEVAAEATGKKRLVLRLRVGESETRRIAVGPFLDEEPAGPTTKEAPSSFFTPLRIAGVAAGAAGLVGLGVAAGFAGAASAKKAESDKDCTGNLCGLTGLPLRQEARSLGDGATVALVVGGTLAAAGLTLVLVGGPPSTTGSRATVTPFASPQAAGLLCRATF